MELLKQFSGFNDKANKMLTREAYKKDLLFQSFVLIPLVFSGLITLTISYDLLILGFLCLFFVGIIQTASCIYHAFIQKVEFHKVYFRYIVFYFFLLIVCSLFSLFNSMLIGTLYIFVLPTVMALYYYYKTWLFRKKAIQKGLPPEHFNEDILDDKLFK